MAKKRGRPRKYATAPITNLDALYRIAKDKGYRTRKELCEYLADYTEYRGSVYAYIRKMSLYYFTYADIMLISDALELTASEFIEVWFPKVFEVEDGTARVRLPEDIKRLLLDRLWNGSQKAIRAYQHRKEHEQLNKNTSEIADFLKNI